MNTFSHVPPGFRFHPTDEELVDYYLRKKVASRQIDLDIIKDVDLYKIEPWDLQELCKIGVEEQNEWYFFSHKDKKYPTGTRTNRATKAGFWKATGRDKAIYMKHSLVGMRKTLVFYQGRAPNGQKSDWIMHEYRLETNENGIPQEEGWVVCRVFKKRMATVRKMGDHESPTCWYDDQVSFMTDMDSPSHQMSQPFGNNPNPHYACKQELELDQFQYTMPQDPYLQLPQLESPKVPQSSNRMARSSSAAPFGFEMNTQNAMQASYQLSGMDSSSFAASNSDHAMVDEALNWRVLDKFVASQLSQEEASNGSGFSNSAATTFHGVGQPMIASVNNDGNRHGTAIPEYPMTSTSSFNVDLWK